MSTPLTRWLRRRLDRVLGPDAARPVSRRKHQARLQVETFEERLVPTVTFDPQFGPVTFGTDASGNALPAPTDAAMKSPDIHLIFWGSGWNGQNLADLTGAAQAIVNGPYYSALGQYGYDGKATFAGATPVSSNPTLTKGILSSDDLQKFLQDQIDKGALPAPGTTDPRSGPIYVVVTPPDATNFNGGFNDIGSYKLADGSTRALHMVWLGTSNLSGKGVDRDDFTRIFSHETAEAIANFSTARQAGLPPALNNPNARQIADFEPEAVGQPSYGYRLGKDLVQPYWSDRDQAFVVPDGNTETFELTPVWNDKRTAFTGKYDLTVRGDQLGPGFADQVTVAGTAQTSTGVNLNDQVATFDPGTIRTMFIDTRDGANHVDVDSLPKDVTLWVNSSGQSNDTVTVGNGTLASVAGTVHVANSSGQTQLSIDDSQSPAAQDITVNDSSVDFGGMGTVNYDPEFPKPDGTLAGVKTISVFDNPTQANRIHANSVGPLTNVFVVGGGLDTKDGPAAGQVNLTT